MHKYLVELRIIGEWLDEDEISGRVGIKASQFVRKGDWQFQKVSPMSVWQLDARPSQDVLEWLSLEEGLTCLLEKLIPVKTALDGLKASYDVSIVCGHFTPGFGGGPTLSPVVLTLLAQLGIKLTISSYCSHGESDVPERDKAAKIDSPR